MKRFKIPMFVASLFGLGVFSGLDAPSARADLTFGEPVNLESVIPAIDPLYDTIDCLSCDGLEMYIQSLRPDGFGGVDLWVLRRSSIDEEWGLPENLGPGVNTAKHEYNSFVSADGLTLYFEFWPNPPSADIYMTTRQTTKSP